MSLIQRKIDRLLKKADKLSKTNYKNQSKIYDIHYEINQLCDKRDEKLKSQRTEKKLKEQQDVFADNTNDSHQFF